MRSSHLNSWNTTTVTTTDFNFDNSNNTNLAITTPLDTLIALSPQGVGTLQVVVVVVVEINEYQ